MTTCCVIASSLRTSWQHAKRKCWPSVEKLSDRELEVLRLIGEGVKTAEIARQLFLSVKTIETYRDRIRQKLGLSDGMDLIRYAMRWVLENR